MTRTVSDVMTRTVVVVPTSASVKQLVGAMREHRVSALPVVDGEGSIVGVVSEADLLLREDPSILEPRFFDGHVRRQERRKAEARTAQELMTAPAITITPDASVADAARSMHERGVKRLPVVDEAGKILGVVSRVDLVGEFLRPDEDIGDDVSRTLVEELALEPGQVVVTVDDGVVRLDGRVELRSFVHVVWAAVRAVPGVVGIDERLTWTFDDTRTPVSPVPWVGM